MTSLGEIGGLVSGIAVAGGSVVGAIIWFGSLNQKIQATSNSVNELKVAHSKELVELDLRLKSMEDHKVSVAVLGSQMSMVLDRISELSRDVKNLLDGHARMAHIREKEDE